MLNYNIENFLGKIVFLILSSTLFIGFALNEDISGGGTSTDFKNTWNYVLALKDGLDDYENIPRILPLHYIILSKLNLIMDKNSLRLFFTFISLLVPILFYLNLNIKFPKINKNLLWCFASSIILFPFFRSSAIWANAHITAFIFFLLAILFFFKWEKEKENTVSFNFIIHITFMSLAVYTRQYYVIFFIYYLFFYFKKLTLINFFKIFLLLFFLSLPGFWMIYNYPAYLFGSGFNYKLYNSLLINSSILSFYLVPIFFPLLFKNINIIKKEKKFFLISIIFSAIFVTVFSIFFNYNPSVGGGFFLKLSNLVINHNSLFYFSAFLGFVLLSYLSKESLYNFGLILLIFIAFNIAPMFQKYLEPMFLFMFFLLFNSNFPKKFLEDYKNLIFFYFYILIYFCTALINGLMQITRNYNFLN